MRAALQIFRKRATKPLVAAAVLVGVAGGFIAGGLPVLGCRIICSSSRFATLDAKSLVNALDLFALEHEGHLPANLSALVPNYVKELRKDPWGNDFTYARVPGGALVISFGPDGRFGGGDDIIERVELKDDGARAQLQPPVQHRLETGERIDITETSPDHYRIKRSLQSAP